MRVEGARIGWMLSLCAAAGEGGGSFRYASQPVHHRHDGPARDPERSAAEAARRARSKARRYCAANGLNRLGTLTYEDKGVHDPVMLRRHLGEFFRALRLSLGGKPFPYLWVPEWHKTDHGLHVHFAVDRYIKKSLLRAVWGRGHVGIKLLGDLPVGSGKLEEARQAARYLSKYIGKDFDHDRMTGLHRYEVAQGFQPETVQLWGRSAEDVIEQASDLMGGKPPAIVWTSDQAEGWEGPPAVWVSWRG